MPMNVVNKRMPYFADKNITYFVVICADTYSVHHIK